MGERNAIQFTFPSDYKFHYPELSALFNIAEEDTYKFCMRTRMDDSHIGELDYDKVKRRGFLRDHWLIFGTGLLIFKYFPFFNYYFGMKVFGTGLWCTSMWVVADRVGLASTMRRNEYMAAQKTAQEVMDGEDNIVKAMQRFANDAKCVEYLSEFKGETEAKIGDYKAALVKKMKEDLNLAAMKQLQGIAGFEASMGSSLQELIVRESAASFREKFPTDSAMQKAALASAVASIGGGDAGADPVSKHFEDAFSSLAGVDLMKAKGDAAGTLAERVAFAQQAKEAEFKQTFMVTAAEAAEVKKVVKEAGPDLDFSKLSEASAKKLDALYTSINMKVGFSLPESLGSQAIPATSDSSTSGYVDSVNSQLAAMQAEVKNARLKAFAQSFA